MTGPRWLRSTSLLILHSRSFSVPLSPERIHFLIANAFISNYRFAVPVWDTAIAGQIIGFLGIGLLFVAKFV